AAINSAITLVSVMALWTDGRAVVLLVVLGPVLILAHRAYASLSARHASLERVYELTKAVSGSAHADDVVTAVLCQAREIVDAGPIGVLTMANTQTGGNTFGPEDARLAETIANHASVAFQNSRLVDRLRFDALHDALTGLPNRTFFHARVGDAIESARSRQRGVAVMLMDLARFREA